MEVMQWEVLSRNARKKCAGTNTGSCWLAPDIKEGRNDGYDIRTIFAKEKAPRKDQMHGAFLVVLSSNFYDTAPKASTILGLEQFNSPLTFA